MQINSEVEKWIFGKRCGGNVERCGKYTQSIGTINSVAIWIIVPIMIGYIGLTI